MFCLRWWKTPRRKSPDIQGVGGNKEPSRVSEFVGSQVFGSKTILRRSFLTKLCMLHSDRPLAYFRLSSPALAKVNSNFTNRTALSGPSWPKLAILYCKHTHWCTKVRIVEIRRLSMSKQYAKIRNELSVHTAANGLRKDVECGETQISVRFRRKITLLVNTVFLHVQLLTAR